MIKKNRRVIFFILSVFTFVFCAQIVFAADPLTLDESINIALRSSASLNIAKEGLKGATAQKREAITGFLPKFSTSYSYTRLSEEPFSRFQGLPDTPPFSALNGMEIPVGTKDNYNWAIEAKQPLFAGGGIWANYQANSIGEDAARLEETAKTHDVVLEVKVAYFNVLRAQKIQEAAQQSVEMLCAHRDIAENYFKVGMIPKNDLLHAEVELANGKQFLIISQNSVELAKFNLNKVLRRNISTPLEVVDILTYHRLNQSFEGCLYIAGQERPEIKVSLLKARQAGKLVNVAQSSYLPSLNLVGNYTRFGDDASVSGSDFKDMESWYVMAVANWDFWEWGRTKFRVDASKARENQAKEASKELNDMVTLEVANAYLKLQETENQILVSQKVIEQAQENFRISEERYKERISTSTDVLEAQTLLTRAKSEYANALGDYNINYARLQKAMGTIWGTDEEKVKTDKVNVKTDESSLKAEEKKMETSDNAVTEISKTNNSDGQVAAPAVTKISALAGNEQKAAKSVSEEDVRNLVNKWLAGWQSGNMEIYQSCYASDFKSKRQNLKSWVSYKARVHKKNKNISIRIEDLKISSDAKTSTAEAVFTQYYSSPILKDKVKKTLMLKNVNGEWKIFKETVASRK